MKPLHHDQRQRLSHKDIDDLSVSISVRLAEQGLVFSHKPLVVSYATAARLLEVSARTVRNLTSKGLLTKVQVSDSPRVLVSSIDEYLTKQIGKEANN